MLNKDPTFPTPLWQILYKEWPWWLAGAIFCFLIASILMSGWPSGLLPNIHYPYSYTGDTLFYSWDIKRLGEGWNFNNPRSGYPFGSNFLDYPGADSGNYLILKILMTLFGEYYKAHNLYFLISFAVTFIASFCVLRSVQLTLPLAFSAATIFNFLPFHFERIPHFFYTFYFGVPIFYYIALKIYYIPDSYRILNNSIEKNLLIVLGFIILSSFGIYYTFFGLVVIMTAGIASFIGRINITAATLTLIACSLIMIGALLNVIPNLTYWHVHHRNPEVAHRMSAESELYGFKLAQLVLPRPNHRLPKFSEINQKYSQRFPLINENTSASLGIMGSLGLAALFFLIFYEMSGRQIRYPTLKIIALITLILFMFGTIGGFGSTFALSISPMLRGWNRVSIFIGFGALLGFFMILQISIRKYLATRLATGLSSIIAGGLLLVGWYDQTIPACYSCNQAVKSYFDMDKNFVQTLENSLPSGSAIYQLPYTPFPEQSPIYNLPEYAPVTGFLNSKKLRWSYGGMKGREGDLFFRALSEKPISTQLEVIKKLGFAGVYIDRRGFADNGQALITAVKKLLGIPPTLTRADDQIVFFRLNPSE